MPIGALLEQARLFTDRPAPGPGLVNPGRFPNTRLAAFLVFGGAIRDDFRRQTLENPPNAERAAKR